MDCSREYIGQVVYNSDPTFSGRCKVRINGLIDGVGPDQMPWIYPKHSTVFDMNGAGSLSVPKIGAIVGVKFEGDIYSGQYHSIENISAELVNEIKDDYVGTHVLLYDSEKDLMIAYQPMTGYKMWLAGSMININSDGALLLHHKNNTNAIEINDSNVIISAAGGGTGSSNGEINITSGATVNITAPTVNIKSNGVNVGGNTFSAVKGEKLIQVLKMIITELGTKYPQVPSSLTGLPLDFLISDKVKIS